MQQCPQLTSRKPRNYTIVGKNIRKVDKKTAEIILVEK